MNLSRIQTTPVLRSIEKIPIHLVHPNPYQPRRTFSEQSIEELARSIARYGLIQPIVVRRINATHYELIAGERRLRASKRAGLSEIDAIIQRVGEQDSAVMALIENLQRENLHFFDEAEAYRNLLLEHGMTQEDLARKIGKNQSTVANKLRILKLTPAVKAAIMANRLTERHARTLLRIQDPRLQLQLIDQIRRESLSRLPLYAAAGLCEQGRVYLFAGDGEGGRLDAAVDGARNRVRRRVCGAAAGLFRAGRRALLDARVGCADGAPLGAAHCDDV